MFSATTYMVCLTPEHEDRRARIHERLAPHVLDLKQHF
jgi:hypothetical protein